MPRHTEQTTNTIVWDRRPDLPQLIPEPELCTTQPPATQTAEGKLLTDHGAAAA
jgi:hypothetical protein